MRGPAGLAVTVEARRSTVDRGRCGVTLAVGLLRFVLLRFTEGRAEFSVRPAGLGEAGSAGLVAGREVVAGAGVLAGRTGDCLGVGDGAG